MQPPIQHETQRTLLAADSSKQGSLPHFAAAWQLRPIPQPAGQNLHSPVLGAKESDGEALAVDHRKVCSDNRDKHNAAQRHQWSILYSNEEYQAQEHLSNQLIPQTQWARTLWYSCLWIGGTDAAGVALWNSIQCRRVSHGTRGGRSALLCLAMSAPPVSQNLLVYPAYLFQQTRPYGASGMLCCIASARSMNHCKSAASACASSRLLWLRHSR
jgi:hypothetical protein